MSVSFLPAQPVRRANRTWLCVTQSPRPRVLARDSECRVLMSLSYSINTSEVTDLHVISYEVERDLNPLVLSNCQYKVEQGRETLQEFDLEKIQRQLTSRFLLGKPRITLKVRPTQLLVRSARLACKWPWLWL